jgi:hypothetical protein
MSPMTDHKDSGPKDSEPTASDRSTGVWIIVLVFGLPLALVFLAQWLIF